MALSAKKKHKQTDELNIEPGAQMRFDPTRKFVVKRTGKQVARMQTMIKLSAIITLALTVLVVLLYLLFYLADNGGDFTVKLDMGARKMISLSETEDFGVSTVRLDGTKIENMWHCTESWIPDDITEYEGQHNSEDPSYMAYSFYLSNTMKEPITYSYSIKLLKQKLAVDEAIRIKIYRNDETMLFGKNQAGLDAPSPAAESFIEDGENIIEIKDLEMEKGTVDKYTVVIWLEGEDPECVNDILGGSIHFEMDFHVNQGDD